MQVTGKEVPHDPSWSLALQVYVLIHFLLVLRTYHDLFENRMVCICHNRQTVNESHIPDITYMGLNLWIVQTKHLKV